MSFFDAFGSLFNGDGDHRRHSPRESDDDPVILDVQVDGDEKPVVPGVGTGQQDALIRNRQAAVGG